MYVFLCCYKMCYLLNSNVYFNGQNYLWGLHWGPKCPCLHNGRWLVNIFLKFVLFKKKQTKKSVAVVQFLMCIGLELMILSLQFSKNRSEYQFERFCIFVGYVNSFMRSYIILLLLSLKGSWNLAYQYIKTVQQILYHRINWKVQFNYLKKKKGKIF